MALDPYAIESWVAASVSVVIVALRVVARIRSVGVKAFQPDDYLMIFIAILFPLECAMAYLTAVYGGTNNMPAEMRAALTDDEVQQKMKGAKFFYIGWLIYPAMLWIMKFCMIFFYRRLTLGLKQQTALTYIAWICGATYIAGLLTVLLSCRPIHKNWQVQPDPGAICTQGWTFYGVTGISNLLTDVMLFCVPMPLVYRAQLSLSRKISLFLLFGLGAFVMLATILRHVMIFKNVYDMGGVAIWAVRETYVACIVGNAPMIKPLVMEILGKAGLTSRSMKGSSGYPKSPEPGSMQLTDQDISRRQKKMRRASKPGMDTLLQTEQGSEEFIMQSLSLDKRQSCHELKPIEFGGSDASSLNQVKP